MKLRELFLLIFLAILILNFGCKTRDITLPDGSHYRSVHVLNKEKFEGAEIVFTNGARVNLKGYSSDQVEGFRAIAEGAAAGVAKAFNPSPVK